MSGDDYLSRLFYEKNLLDPVKFENAVRLLNTEIDYVKANNNNGYSTAPLERESHGHEPKPFFKEEKIKLNEKVYLPVKEFCNYNFIGKLLGPKGSTLKAVATTSKTKISVLGLGSLRDKQKEEELSASCEPQYEHLKEPLHILIQVEAPKSEAHARVATALNELQRCMIPERNKLEGDSNGFNYGKSQDGHHANNMRGIGGPIIRIGIPPPGAIVLNGQIPTGRGTQGRGSRMRPSH